MKNRQNRVKDSTIRIFWIIVLLIIIPIGNIIKHLLCCPYCSQTGLNPFCLLRCIWSIPFGLVFVMLDTKDEKGDDK